MPILAPEDRPPASDEEAPSWSPATPVGDDVEVTTRVLRIVVAGTVVRMTAKDVEVVGTPSAPVVTTTLDVETVVGVSTTDEEIEEYVNVRDEDTKPSVSDWFPPRLMIVCDAWRGRSCTMAVTLLVCHLVCLQERTRL